MPSSVSLHIAQPCPESWAAMLPAGPGRHCAACQKTVVDFTHQTDAEILAYFRQAGIAGICGHFRPAQLGRPLAATAAVPRWRAWLPALVAAVGLEALLPARGAAQNPLPAMQKVAAEAKAQPSVMQAVSAPAATYAIEGVVTDDKNEPLPGATVLLEGTTVGVSTDQNGKFRLSVTCARAKAFLVFSFVGFEPVRKRIAFKAASRPVRVKLTPYLLGGIGFTVPPTTRWQQLTRFFTRKTVAPLPETPLATAG